MQIEKGTRVIVTGASRGIGRALVESLLQRGAIVGINTRDTDTKFAKATIGRAVPLTFDVRDFEAASSSIDEFGRTYGGIDILINNAAFGRRPQFLVRLSKETIDELIHTNLIGAIYCTRAVISHMKSGGKIAFMSSISVANPVAGIGVYTVSKAGVESFAASIDAEYRRKGITALAIRFGPVRTRLVAHLESSIPDMPSPEEAAVRTIKLLEQEQPSVVVEA